MIDLAVFLEFFVYSEVPDNASSNKRYGAWLMQKLPRIIFFHFAGCAVHKAHNIVSCAVREKLFVGDTYAMHYVIVQPRLYAVLLHALRLP